MAIDCRKRGLKPVGQGATISALHPGSEVERSITNSNVVAELACHALGTDRPGPQVARGRVVSLPLTE